ncbi:MAG: selenocysteine-specific translation elongation factor [Myxococcota bacterium]
MSSEATNLIVGTAGHIDHGKTSLVRALTGVDLDRLPEEKDRGITIALGFTHLSLPSGRNAAFIDVPGHERLIRTMIAGATGLDAVMLCVSAVEGVMPQTREHLSILEILGVSQGLIALTMTDLVDEEMRELAEMDIEEAVAGTFLEGAPVIASASPPDGEMIGHADLIAALDALHPPRRSANGPFRLPIDRAFIQRGFGTVVTGTARSGTLSDGDEIEILPEGLRARIRGMQVHGEAVGQAAAGQRTAINLAGIERDDLARGMTLTTPGAIPPSSILDARVQHLREAPAIPHGARVRLLVDTAEVMAVMSVLDGDELTPGGDHLIQLRTETPMVTLTGDRFVLRRESPLETLGGGTILDPWARRVRRKHHDRAVEELMRLEGGDRSVLLLRAGEAGLGASEAGLYGVPEAEATVLGGRWFHAEQRSSMRALLLEMLSQWHRDHPLLPGAPRRDLRRDVFQRLPEGVFVDLIEMLAADGAVVLEGPRIRAADFSIRLSPAQAAAKASLEAEVRAAGLQGPKAADKLKQQGPLVHLLLDAGALERVGPYLIHRASLDAARAQVTAWLDEHDAMLPTDFKEMTGLSRKYAIPLLEWLDASGITRRCGDRRVRA